jgi:hypothetical protein
MLDHLGHVEWSASLMRAIERTVARPETRTVDLGGTATTEQVGDSILAELASVVPTSAVKADNDRQDKGTDGSRDGGSSSFGPFRLSANRRRARDALMRRDAHPWTFGLPSPFASGRRVSSEGPWQMRWSITNAKAVGRLWLATAFSD